MSKASATGSAWQTQRRRVLDRDGWRCAACGKELVGGDATVDHLEPISWNPGAKVPDSALRAMCRACNGRRADAPLRRVEYANRDWLPNGIPR